MSAITTEEAETYRQLAKSLHAAGEMPLEGEATDPLIEVFNSLGHQAGDAIARLLSLATPDPERVTGRVRWEGRRLYLGTKPMGHINKSLLGKWNANPSPHKSIVGFDTEASARDALVAAVKEAIGDE